MGSAVRTRDVEPVAGRDIGWALLVGLVALLVVGAVLRYLTGDDAEYSEIARTAVISVAAIGAVPAAYIAYRRQRTTELQRMDGREDADRARQQDFRDRFGAAAEQLGHGDPATRMAGVYAMARLADDWYDPGDATARQMCVDVLCAYLRLPPASGSVGRNTEQGGGAHGEREVRRTLIRVIRDHLREDKTPNADVRWSDLSFFFEGAHIDYGDFTGSQFRGKFVSFHGVTFSGSSVIHFDKVHFGAAQVNFSKARFMAQETSFAGAVFAGGEVRFTDVQFGGEEVSFEGAVVQRGSVDFGGAVVQRGTRLVRRGFVDDRDAVHWGRLGVPATDGDGRVSDFARRARRAVSRWGPG